MMRESNGTPAADPAQAVALCEQAVALEQSAGTAVPALALTALGSAYAFDGRFDQAATILDDAWRRRGQGHWSRSLDLQLAGLLAVSLLQLGHGPEVDRVLTEAEPFVAVAEQNWGGAAAPLVVQLRLAAARRRYELGDFEAASHQLDRSLRLAEQAGNPLTLALTLIYLADLELAGWALRRNVLGGIVQNRPR